MFLFMDVFGAIAIVAAKTDSLIGLVYVPHPVEELKV